MSRVELLVPDLGNFTEVAVVDVLVKPGERIDVELERQAASSVA